jgi:L-aspartate oxidase
MWRHVGLVRSAEGLQQALKAFDDLDQRYGLPAPTRAAIELANMITTARLVTHAALERTESRGAHYRLDYPQIDEAHWHCHLLLRCEENEFRVERLPVD